MMTCPGSSGYKKANSSNCLPLSELLSFSALAVWYLYYALAFRIGLFGVFLWREYTMLCVLQVSLPVEIKEGK